MGQARDQAGRYRIAGKCHHDRSVARVFLGSQGRGIAAGDDDIDMAGNQLVNQARQAAYLALSGPVLENNVLALDIAALRKTPCDPLTQDQDAWCADRDQPDTVDFARLGERARMQ